MARTRLTARAVRKTAEEKVQSAEQRVSKYPNRYFQIANPSRSLELSGAASYVKSNRVQNNPRDPFVYYQPRRAAGHVSQIAAHYGLTANQVLQNSINPADPAHSHFIQQARSVKGGSRGGVSRNPGLTYQEALAMLAAYRQHKQAIKPVKAAPAPKAAASRKGRARRGSSPASLQKKAAALAEKIATVQGNPDKVLNVSNFKASTLTGATQQKSSAGTNSTIVGGAIKFGHRSGQKKAATAFAQALRDHLQGYGVLANQIDAAVAGAPGQKRSGGGRKSSGGKKKGSTKRKTRSTKGRARSRSRSRSRSPSPARQVQVAGGPIAPRVSGSGTVVGLGNLPGIGGPGSIR